MIHVLLRFLGIDELSKELFANGINLCDHKNYGEYSLLLSAYTTGTQYDVQVNIK